MGRLSELTDATAVQCWKPFWRPCAAIRLSLAPLPRTGSWAQCHINVTCQLEESAHTHASDSGASSSGFTVKKSIVTLILHTTMCNALECSLKLSPCVEMKTNNVLVDRGCAKNPLVAAAEPGNSNTAFARCLLTDRSCMICGGSLCPYLSCLAPRACRPHSLYVCDAWYVLWPPLEGRHNPQTRRNVALTVELVS